MMSGKGWSRRHFLAVSSAVAAHASAEFNGFSQSTSTDAAAAQRRYAAEAARTMPPPGVITGGIEPLMESMTQRPLRYTPVAGEFVIRNGTEFFNRPIYGVSSPTHSGDFRVDAGDLPEFSMYLPGHGGNLKLGIVAADGSGSKWAAQADEVIARYRPGRMIYEIRDTTLGKGVLHVEVLTTGEGAGYMVKAEATSIPAHTRLAWAFAGVSGRKGQRNGDIGCERQPVKEFFQVRPEECDGNQYEILPSNKKTSTRVNVISKAARLGLSFPAASKLSITDFEHWTSPLASPEPGAADAALSRPMLQGSIELSSGPVYLALQKFLEDDSSGWLDSSPETFATRSAQVETLLTKLQIGSPDEYINAAAGNFGVVAETLWDQRQQCVLHGGVAWRSALVGWRGPYVLDALGEHDRAVQDIRHWLQRQNTTPITTGDPATGPWDPNIHLTRKERLLHSNGDLSNNHYDMNLVFVDMLLRHLMWTGDMALAREVWPALQRHLAWEHRLFRRTYTSSTGKILPLYEAYAAIWASDNLQYNGGGAAHSSAYNIFALRTAAKLAQSLGEDGSAYQTEADLLHQGMQELLWLPEQGAFGESKDLMQPQTAYTNPALWTVYHTIDSEVPTAKQAWQITAERLAVLKHIPIHGDGVPDGGWYCSRAPIGFPTCGPSTCCCSPRTRTWRSLSGRPACATRPTASSRARCWTRCTWASAPATST
jgi:hypothetical protein